MSAAVRAGISLETYFIVGFPGETADTVKRTIETINAFETPTDSVSQLICFPFILMPLAEIFERPRRQEHRLSGYLQKWQHRTMSAAEASDHVCRVSREVETMQPYFGNIEQLIVRNRSVLAELDQLRGRWFRRKLEGGGEDPHVWEQMIAAVSRLRVDTDERTGLVALV